MRKFLFYLILLISIFIPLNTFAIDIDENDFEVVAQEEKYYKTVTVINNNMSSIMSIYNYDSNSITEEITKEEYDSFIESNISTNGSITLETNYKKLTTSILSNGSYYRYKAVLNWKNMPKVRSYDTIAIGYYASVKPRGLLNFSQSYCMTDGSCEISTSYYPHTFTAGSSATFGLPDESLTSLSQTFYFDVQKAVDSTIIEQNASGDYAHAVKSISYTNAQKYTVSNTGIHFDSSVENYFDEINYVRVTWKGSW